MRICITQAFDTIRHKLYNAFFNICCKYMIAYPYCFWSIHNMLGYGGHQITKCQYLQITENAHSDLPALVSKAILLIACFEMLTF